MPHVPRHPARFRAYRMGASKPLGKAKPFRHIIALAFVRPNNEYSLHATKGYRWRRLPPNRNLLLEQLMQNLQFRGGQLS